MRGDRRGARRPVPPAALRRVAAAGLLTSALASGCTAGPAGPSGGPSIGPSPSATPEPRPFTVATTETPRSFDPAESQTGADAVVALNVFQRLMTVSPEVGSPKPDAADCLFSAPTVYRCTLTKELTFSNGHALTASDVKFSIERAYRLNVPRSSIKLFASLQRVDVVDDLTVEFTLAWHDSQFGHALATPAASIVDEESYDPDNARPTTAAPIGSGPFRLDLAETTGLTFVRNDDYAGPAKPGLETIRLAYLADSAAAEQAMTDGTVDVVWRSLDAAALGRLASGTTKAAFTRTDLPAARMERLIWNPASALRPRADVRTAVAQALQADRTLTSLVPPQLEGSVPSFPVGGRPTIAPIAGKRLNLTLAYSTRAPGQGDLARLLRDRLESNAGLSVKLVTDTTDADLILTDRGAWVNTPLAWLQSYLDDPLPASATKVTQLGEAVRQTDDKVQRASLLSEIQQQAAIDATVVPISLGPEPLFVADGVSVAEQAFGPCWQLGLWGFGR
jgi:peptide/nickel transport system substrate-binding protein